MTHRLGLIINPIAGMGGSVGLKGTDGDLVERARAMGAMPVAEKRAIMALEQLTDLGNQLLTLTCSGEMGATAAEKAGLLSRVLSRIDTGKTTANDTRRAASEILEHRPDLLLFVGGDGTARDILEVMDQQFPVLGVPSGVKMHSAVFAASPRAAGEVARRFLLADNRESLLRDAEVLDRERSGADGPGFSPKLFGMLRTPHVAFLVPGAKSASRISEQAALEGAILRVIDIIDDQRVSLIGPGSTMQSLKRRLGFDGTPLGVDAVQGGHCVAEDVNELEIIDLIQHRPARVVLSIVGGQGFLFGRGNQQFSPRVIRQVGFDNIVIVSSLDKLTTLSGNCLLVDTGDEELDDDLSGHMPVIVSGGRTVMMPVKNASFESLH
jgi:predicted polyphosphate/ATP-dependent NAD kinase